MYSFSTLDVSTSHHFDWPVLDCYLCHFESGNHILIPPGFIAIFQRKLKCWGGSFPHLFFSFQFKCSLYICLYTLGSSLTLTTSFFPLWLLTHLLIIQPLPWPLLLMKSTSTVFVSLILTLTVLLFMLWTNSCSSDGASSGLECKFSYSNSDKFVSFVNNPRFR